jgi:hypothetical protein
LPPSDPGEERFVTHPPLRRLVGVVPLLIAAITLSACQRTARPKASEPCEVDARAGACDGDRPFRQGDAADRARMDAAVARLSSADAATFDDAARRVVALGERAVPSLLDALVSPNATLRAHAALVLGVIEDRRTIPDLARVAADDPDPNVRCEAGRALVSMGDARGFDPLIDGLASDDACRRTRCIDALAETTRKRLGFEPDGPTDERNLAVSRWRAWRERQRLESCPPCPPDETQAPDKAKDSTPQTGAPRVR